MLIDNEYTIVAANGAYVESYASPGDNALPASFGHVRQPTSHRKAIEIIGQW